MGGSKYKLGDEILLSSLNLRTNTVLTERKVNNLNISC